MELRSYSDEMHAHQHDHHQLVLPVVGQLVMDIAGRQGVVAEQQVAIIAAGQTHGFAATGDNRFVVADLPVALAPALERFPHFIPLDTGLMQYITFIDGQLNFNNSGSGSLALRRSSERQMLLLLIQLLQQRTDGFSKQDRRVIVACDYLEQNFQHTISLTKLAAVASISPRQLSELFRRQLGISPRHYQIELRMQRASHLLQQGGLSIQQVADQVGYQSLAAFSDRFHRHFGISPRNHCRQTQAPSAE